MIFKILTLGLVIFFIYILFFKKNRVEKNNPTNNKNQDIIADEMMECPTCKILISKDEAILSNGKYYCSQECLRG